MCGRYGLQAMDSNPETVAEYFAALTYIKSEWKGENYNIKPTTEQAMVYEDAGERRMIHGTWGWRRSFSKAPLINARGEEAASKRTWIEALRSRRCIVPASFFYEWRPTDKQPFVFALDSMRMFGIGGLWETTPVGISFVLLTTTPNEICSPIHDRMPLILPRAGEATWLNPHSPFDQVQDLITPYPHEAMSSWQVSKLVSGIHNDGPALIEPVKPTAEGFSR